MGKTNMKGMHRVILKEGAFINDKIVIYHTINKSVTLRFPTAAPFSDCHEVVDVETALYNCKYDTCSCFDASCACHAVKEYVKECQEKGVTTLGAWRDEAPYCSKYINHSNGVNTGD